MRYLIAALAACVVLVASAIEPPKTAAPATPQPAQPAADAPDPPAPKAEEPQAAAIEEEEEELPPLPADITPAGPPPARFNPTEKVRADFPVSFPIDI